MAQRLICLIFEPGDMRLLEQLGSDEIKETLFIPFGFEAYIGLKRMGLATDPAWTYYQLDELNERYWANLELTRTWFVNSAAHITQCGIRIAAADAMFLYYFLVECDFFKMVLSRIILQHRNAEYLVFAQAGVFQQVHRDNKDTPIGIFNYLCDDLRIKVRRIPAQRKAPRSQLPRVASFSNAPTNNLAQPQSLARMLLVSSGGNYFRDYLSATRGIYDVIACYCETLTPAAFQALQAMTKVQTLYIGRREASYDIDKRQYWLAYNVFQAVPDCLVDAYPHIFRNPHFQEFFRWLFTIRWPAVAELAIAAESE